MHKTASNVMNAISRIALCLVIFLSASTVLADERPNIVLVMVDDLGFSDLGCYGGEIETPTLDALARDGVRMSQFYNTAKCHSSRVCLLTGLWCGQAGSNSLARGVTIAEVLRDAGYTTLMTGKWHLSGEPTDRGFDRYFGHLSGCTNFFTGDKTFRLDGKPWNDFDEDFYMTDANVEYAIKFLDEAKKDKPFFLYIAFNAPHYPLHAPEKDVMKYRGTYRDGWEPLREKRYARQLEMGLIDPRWKLSPPLPHVRKWEGLSEKDRDWEDFRMAAYAGMVDRVDQQLGELVAYLKKTDRWNNTLFLFCSDNGGCPFERTRGREFKPWDPKSYWTYDTGWAHACNTPFRWYKQNQHEGGISSPLIAHWPAGIKAKSGSIDHQPGHLVDFMATAVDLGKAKYPKEYKGRRIEPLQGRSLAPILQGEKREPHPYLYFHFSNNRALRVDDWKVVSARGGPWELYNMAEDRTELNDLAAEKLELLMKLSGLWHEVAEKIDRLPENQRRPVREKSTSWNSEKKKNNKKRN